MGRRNRDDDDRTTEYFEEEGGDFDDDFGDDFDDDDETRERDHGDDYAYNDDDGGKTVETGKRKKLDIFGFIVVKKGRRKNDRYDLTQEDVIIGRSQRCCDILIDDEDVSKIHCRIRKDPDKNEFHFFDCGSTNGTLVNGEEVHHKILSSHDIISLGESVEIVFIQV